MKISKKTWVVIVSHWDAISSMVVDVPITEDPKADGLTACNMVREAISLLDRDFRIVTHRILGPARSAEDLLEDARTYCGQFSYVASTAEDTKARTPGIEVYFEKWRKPEMPQSAEDEYDTHGYIE